MSDQVAEHIESLSIDSAERDKGTLHYTNVIIVGAGPTGLTLALNLASQEIPIKIVERRSSPRDTSRAMTIHARTLEQFDFLGLADEFNQHGIPSKGMIFHFMGKEAGPFLDISVISSPFPYVLIIPQSILECLLLKRLRTEYGIVPEWSSNVVSVRDCGNSVEVDVQTSGSNDSNTYCGDYIVGCDGNRSTVRDAAGLTLDEFQYEDLAFRMMDTKLINFPHDNEWMHYYISKNSFLLVAQLPPGGETGSYRVAMSSSAHEKVHMSDRYMLERELQTHIPEVQFAEPEWSTTWRSWKRLVKSYQKGRIVLAGDAAHVHSPSGGQGVNIGLQDVANLSWRLSFVIKGWAGEEFLTFYDRERRPIGQQVIDATDKMHSIAMAHGKRVEHRLGEMQSHGWLDDVVTGLSGLKYHYKGVVEVPPALALCYSGFGPGERADPCLLVAKDLELRHAIRQANGKLLGIVTPNEDRNKNDNGIRESMMETKGTLEEVNGIWVTIADCNCVLPRNRLIVVRPDGYIVLHCLVSDISKAVSWIRKWLCLTSSSITKILAK